MKICVFPTISKNSLQLIQTRFCHNKKTEKKNFNMTFTVITLSNVLFKKKMIFNVNDLKSLDPYPLKLETAKSLYQPKSLRVFESLGLKYPDITYQTTIFHIKDSYRAIPMRSDVHHLLP